jgi:hypothetical protein
MSNKSWEKICFCKFSPPAVEAKSSESWHSGAVFTTLHMDCNLQMGPISLRFALHKAWKDLSGTNTLTNRKHSLVMKCCECSLCVHIHNTSFSLQLTNVLNKLECLSLASLSSHCNVKLKLVGPIRKLQSK